MKLVDAIKKVDAHGEFVARCSGAILHNIKKSDMALTPARRLKPEIELDDACALHERQSAILVIDYLDNIIENAQHLVCHAVRARVELEKVRGAHHNTGVDNG